MNDQPDFVPAWLALGELCLKQGRWADLEHVIGRIGALSSGEMEALVLRARAHLSRQEFALAKRILEDACGRFPRQLLPLRILGYVLLQEGKDLVAAERALRELLLMDPTDAEARRNLEVLLRNQESRGTRA